MFIQLKNASKVYGQGESAVKALDGAELSAEQGEVIVVLGPSGSGKTPFCNLVARFWDVDSGTVKLGGINVKDYALDSLMRNFSMVFQRVYLFNDSIENNIKFGKPDATHEEVVAAAKADAPAELNFSWTTQPSVSL